MSGSSTARRIVGAITATLLTSGLALVAAVGPAEATETVTSAERLDAIRAMDPETYEARVQRLINRKRAARGLAPVRLSSCADRIAEDWGRHLAATLQFHHQDLTTVIRRCDATYAGETLARGAVSPQEMVRLWMNSDGHRHILLSRYPNRVGIGAYQDSRGDWVVAADFAKH